MIVTIQEQDGNAVAYLEGRLDTPTAIEAEKALSPLYDCNGQDIIIDCTDLEYICSAGLRIFLRILKSAKEKGDQLYIRGVSDDIRAVFAMTGFINIFQFK
jgi:anti-sigma B factor antagonist